MSTGTWRKNPREQKREDLGGKGEKDLNRKGGKI